MVEPVHLHAGRNGRRALQRALQEVYDPEPELYVIETQPVNSAYAVLICTLVAVGVVMLAVWGWFEFIH